MSHDASTSGDGKLVTAGFLAAKFGTSTGTILEWYHKGRIPAEVAEGTTFRFIEADVVRVMEERMILIKQFRKDHQEAIEAGAKPWNLPGPTIFREKMDAARAAERVRITKDHVIKKGYPIPKVGIKSNYEPWMHPYHLRLIPVIPPS